MADCEKLSACPFFNNQLAYMPRTARALRKTYCHGDKTTCARYLVAIQGIQPPGDLFPNHLERAREILSKAKPRSTQPKESPEKRHAAGS